MQDGFLFDELSELKKDLLRSIKDKYPDETKKFIKGEAKKLTNVAKKIAKKQIGTSKNSKKEWIAEKSYHKKWKAGVPYKYSEGDLCCRAYNSAPHAHMLEYGHRQVPRGKKGQSNKGGQANGFTDGNMIMFQAETDFLSDWLNDCEKFFCEYVEDTINGKI